MPAVDSYRNDPVCRAVRRLVDAGVVVFAAAGNNGKDSEGNKLYGHIHAPGNEPSAITVGATNTLAPTTAVMMLLLHSALADRRGVSLRMKKAYDITTT